MPCGAAVVALGKQRALPARGTPITIPRLFNIILCGRCDANNLDPILQNRFYTVERTFSVHMVIANRVL